MPCLSKKTSSKRSIEIIDSPVSHNTRFRMQQRETVEEFCKFIGSPEVVQKKDVWEVLMERDDEDVEKTVPDGDDITTGGNGRENCQVGDHIARSHEEFFQEDTDRISLGFEGRSLDPVQLDLLGRTTEANLTKAIDDKIDEATKSLTPKTKNKRKDTLCDVKGTLAVPVFEETSNMCLAVIELIMKSEKVQYGPELDIIGRALKGVSLSTSGCQSPPSEVRSEERQRTLAEILGVLIAVCETHKLPLAQTWVPSLTDANGNEQQLLLNALCSTMQRVCRNLRPVTSKELEEEQDGSGRVDAATEENVANSATFGSKSSDVSPHSQDLDDQQGHSSVYDHHSDDSLQHQMRPSSPQRGE
ncbi:hypothetical protein R1sor_026903 [Riccia sorocarpa]|uniref:NLP1-9 GAF domain-containing protein n=1 Tax=Riccia sorocarpa TaxID=122646 RepID=A0ABD3GFV4_9MARC